MLFLSSSVGRQVFLLFYSSKKTKFYFNSFSLVNNIIKNYKTVIVNPAIRHHHSSIQIINDKTMKDTTADLEKLRTLMRNLSVTNNGSGLKSIAAYIIPTDDAHQSEYISEHDERRKFLTGFSGSAGTAVVTQTEARLWTDGRYYQQAEKEMDKNWTLMKDSLSTTPNIGTWLSKNLLAGDSVGVDPNIISCNTWNLIATKLEDNGIALVAINTNLIDEIWTEQPKQTSNGIIKLSTSVTGKSIDAKITEIRQEMNSNNSDILVVTALDEVAWLLNMRGSDIDYNPVFYGYVIITKNLIYLFVDAEKLPENYSEHFADNKVEVKLEKYQEVSIVLKELIKNTSGKVWIGMGSCYGLAALVPHKRRHQEISPITPMKAIKNDIEAEGMRAAHVRDGVALCQYFAWLEEQVEAGKYVDEITGASQLEELRKIQDKFMGLSFPTISASGPNGSVIHYHPAEETKRQITTEEIYLCDSGAQYLDGTTDVTRTWHFGKPSEFEIESNTRVLKGQMSLGRAIFPTKVRGHVLDTLARKSLWDVGLDYGHGTGHGIGHFLNVHEGPMGISFRLMPDDPGLQVNMFLSNEPGFYQDGKFGIRIEDIVQIVPAENLLYDFNGRGALTFKTITMCPIQTKLINGNLLNDEEKTYLNNYHQTVWNTLSPLLEIIDDKKTLAWLKKETAAI